MSIISERVSGWYHLTPEDKIEALNNLSKENFNRHATNFEWPLDCISSLESSGHLSLEQAREARNKVYKLTKKFRRS